MKTEMDPTFSSHNMMQKSIDQFTERLLAKDIFNFGREITLKFIEHGVIRNEAIAHLKSRIDQGVLCILSTGSYQDGAQGFVDALIEKGLLSEKNRDLLKVSGAIVDWKNKKLLHANIRDRKLIGISQTMNHSIDSIRPHIENVYADDPFVNDKNILALAPKGKGYVISTIKNKDKPLPDEYTLTTWQQIIDVSKECKETKTKRSPCST